MHSLLHPYLDGYEIWSRLKQAHRVVKAIVCCARLRCDVPTVSHGCLPQRFPNPEAVTARGTAPRWGFHRAMTPDNPSGTKTSAPQLGRQSGSTEGSVPV